MFGNPQTELLPQTPSHQMSVCACVCDCNWNVFNMVAFVRVRSIACGPCGRTSTQAKTSILLDPKPEVPEHQNRKHRYKTHAVTSHRLMKRQYYARFWMIARFVWRCQSKQNTASSGNYTPQATHLVSYSMYTIQTSHANKCDGHQKTCDSANASSLPKV